MGFAAFKLLMVPGLCETFFDGGLAVALFGMPVTFGFALGSILNAVGPALVVQCMSEVQEMRLGLDRDMAPTVVAAAGFDGELAPSFQCGLRSTGIMLGPRFIWFPARSLLMNCLSFCRFLLHAIFPLSVGDVLPDFRS